MISVGRRRRVHVSLRTILANGTRLTESARCGRILARGNGGLTTANPQAEGRKRSGQVSARTGDFDNYYQSDVRDIRDNAGRRRACVGARRRRGEAVRDDRVPVSPTISMNRGPSRSNAIALVRTSSARKSDRSRRLLLLALPSALGSRVKLALPILFLTPVCAECK